MSDLITYEKKLEEIRREVEKAEWKYLRENNKRYFSEKRNKSLQDYLQYIFPEIKDWEWNKSIPAKLQRELASKELKATKRYRPDAFSYELKMVVEFDGKPHYQSPVAIINDAEKNEYYKSTLGLTIVRIPYWIQLSKVNIEYLFKNVSDHIRKDIGPMCTLEYSFF